MNILTELSEALQKGRAKIVKEKTQQALDEGLSAEEILNQGLLAGMSIIGKKFKVNEVYVPDVLVSARALNGGLEILKPILAESGIKSKGTIIIGTVKGDLHDIGKNLVGMMMMGVGLDVIDLGVDVSAEDFVKAVREHQPQIVGLSALLTTTMAEQKNVVSALVEAGLRDQVKIMVGGAPVNDQFAKSIGADAYTPDAASASERALEFV